MLKFDARDFRFQSQKIRQRLRGFSVKPWEKGSSGWNPQFVSACVWSRYVKHSQTRYPER